MPETDWPYDADQHDPLTALRIPGCRFSGLTADGTCGKPAVLVAAVGCIHEHVFEGVSVCQYHVEELAAEDTYCLECLAAGCDYCLLVVAPRSVRVLELAAHSELFLA